MQEVPGNEVVRISDLTLREGHFPRCSACGAEGTKMFRCQSLGVKPVLPLHFNPQDGLWEQGSFAQHVLVPVGSAAPHSPDSDSEARYEHDCHGRAQHHHGARVFHGGTDDNED